MTAEQFPPIGQAAAAAASVQAPVKPNPAAAGQRGPSVLARLDQLEQALAAAAKRIVELERTVGING